MAIFDEQKPFLNEILSQMTNLMSRNPFLNEILSQMTDLMSRNLFSMKFCKSNVTRKRNLTPFFITVRSAATKKEVF